MLPTLFRRPRLESPAWPLSRDVDRLFEEFLDWRGNGAGEEETAMYPVDIREENGKILVDAEMPGFDKKEVEVTIDKGVLTICAQHKEEKEENGKGKSHLRERRYRRIERSFTLPAAVDESGVDANLKDGVLHLCIQKSRNATPQKIIVK